MDVGKRCLDALVRQFRDAFGPGLVHHAFQCEISDKKQSLLLTSDNVELIFDNAVSLGSGVAFDVRSGLRQEVPKVDLLVAGFSCKSISHLNTSPSGLLDTSSTTGLTLRAVCKYIDYAHPSVVVLENVGCLLHKRAVDRGKRPVDLLDAKLVGWLGATTYSMPSD
jgi:site-specific DNA-cytosine methylase